MITTVQAGGQFQVVIGNHVKDAYQFVTELVTIDENAGAQVTKGRNSKQDHRCDLSDICSVFVYTCACGILQGILRVLVALNAIDTTGGTYQILNFISWTAFTFYLY